MIEVVAPGIATTVQDRGRPGFAHVGVGAAGAVDPELAGLTNRLVGNGADAAVFETCGGLEIAAHEAVIVAGSHTLTPTELRRGERLRMPSGAHGRLWHYLAIRGGLDTERVLTARSHDTMSGLGGPPPTAGAIYSLGVAASQFVPVDSAPLAELSHIARVSRGPRADWFEPDAYMRFAEADWTVTTTSRVGVRLRGPKLTRVCHDELPSEGLVRGAVQLPPNGEPVMMLADHPTTGGYPVIAVVHPDDVAVVAQHAAGGVVGFRHAM